MRDDLDLRAVDVQRLGGGTQHGADLRASWVGPRGEARLWLIECKSHTAAALPEKEVADKLLQAARSAEQPDVWCLALSDAEPAPNTWQTLADAPRRLGAGFAATVLSQRSGGIHRLYACH